MLKKEDAVRAESTPDGMKWYHRCLTCQKEIGPNSSFHLRLRTGYCNSCVKRQQHPRNQHFKTLLKTQATRAGVDVNLSEEEMELLQEINMCAYCGSSVNPTHGALRLDRKDPQRGYVSGNVVRCCYSCNKVKSDVLTFEEMQIAMREVMLYRSASNDRKLEMWAGL